MVSNNVVWFAAVSLALAACSARDSHTSVPGADLITGESDSVAASGVTLTLTPSVLRTCEHPDGRTAINASWDVRSSGATSVTIWVSEANSDEKRWFHGSSVGNANTGPWAVDGLIFRIEDGDKKGRTLVTRVFHAITCLAEPQAAPAINASAQHGARGLTRLFGVS